MRFKITGWGEILTAQEVAEKNLFEFFIGRGSISLIVEARSVEDLLERHEIYSGYWDGEKFYYFDGKPEITPLPEDQNLRCIGSPMLPGLSAY